MDTRASIWLCLKLLRVPDSPKHLFALQYWPSWLGVGLMRLLAQLPQVIRHELGRQLGAAVYRYNHKRREIIQRNLQYCFPELSSDDVQQLARENTNHTLIGLLEYATLVFSKPQKLLEQVRVQNPEFFAKLATEDTGVLLLLLHSPLLDFAAPALAQYAPSGSYKAFNNEVFDHVILQARKRFMGEVVPRDAGFRSIVRALQQKQMFNYLPDEDFGPKHSVFAPFFAGEKATLTTVARLAKSTDCVCVPMMMVWDETHKQYLLTHQGALEYDFSQSPQQQATTLNQALMALILPYRSQYLWSLKLFRSRPEGQPSLYD